MKSSFFSKAASIWGIQKEFRLKVLFLVLSFFMLTACQAIWRPLKTAVFISIVGVKSIPDAKFFLMIPLIVLIIFYSKLVDWFRRHQIFYWFALTHGIGGYILYYFLSHPVYGLANTTQSKGRIFGWIFYFFMESFGAFMSAVFWSFANSINKPKDAKNYYSLFVSGSKVGGILGSGFLYFCTQSLSQKINIHLPKFLLIGSTLLLLSALMIFLLMKYVPGYLMHGYEAAYQAEKNRSKTGDECPQAKGIIQSIKEALNGLFLIIKNSYVFGILTIILSYEIIIVIFDYLVALAAAKTHHSATALANYYALYMLLMHAFGLFIALFGTAPIQRFLGVRLSLFACPILAIIIIITSLVTQSPTVLFFSLVALRALNYGLNHPTREALFIPTTKAIKFKAKAWTDAFGSRIAKATGSLLNKHVLLGIVHISTVFTVVITSFWIVIAYFLGKKYQTTIDRNSVIGSEND